MASPDLVPYAEVLLADPTLGPMLRAEQGETARLVLKKIEDMLPRLESKLSMSIRTKRTEPVKESGNLMPYAIDVVSIDNAGIVHDIIDFFAVNKISVQDIQANTYKAINTGAPMMSLHITISISASKSIAAIRTDFMDFCDHHNLDAIMEPVK